MVRTKKQVIESLATKSKQNKSNLADSIADEQNISTTSEFYAPNIPTSPLPTSMYQEKAKISLQQYHPAIFAARSNPYFQPPPYVTHNLLPPPPQSSIQNVLTAGVCGKRLDSTFSNLNQQEIHEMMIDCKGNEDEAILRLITQSGYLEYIRHRISLHSRNLGYVQNAASPSTQQQNLLQRPIQPHYPNISTPLPHSQAVVLQSAKEQPKDNETAGSISKSSPENVLIQNSLITNKPTTLTVFSSQSDVKPGTQYKIHKKHQRFCKSSKSNISGGSSSGGGGGRLTLDDALQQIQDSKNNGETDNYAGWSAARLRAFKMIDKNPNSYYYRFNAPGEQQKKGKWTEEENALFLKRLKQVGANSQWGIFSIAIPGRVGYQCSNYYRFMIEMGQLHDPNYVLDERGKARYLFDKKTEDGAVEKIFRKHSKHGSAPVKDLNILKSSTRKRKQNRWEEGSDDDDDPTFSIKKTVKKKAILPATKRTLKNTLENNSNRRVTRQSIQHQEHEEMYDDNSDSNEQQADHVVPN